MAAALRGLITFAFTHTWNFLLVFLQAVGIFRPLGWYFGLEAGIWASTLRFEPPAEILAFRMGLRPWGMGMGFGTYGWILCLKTGIWASRLGIRP